MRRAALPTCIQISGGEGVLKQDSVALCHQIRVLDQSRLFKRLGKLELSTITALELITALGYADFEQRKRGKRDRASRYYRLFSLLSACSF